MAFNQDQEIKMSCHLMWVGGGALDNTEDRRGSPVCTCQDGFVGLKLLASDTQWTVCEARVLPQAPQLIC